MNWVAYHDRTSADHQAQFDSLYPKGWRMISLSVYGARGDERYAAVWVERAGPDWSAVHGINGPAYQLAFNNNTAAGFRPVLLSVTGPANDPVFAGTFELSPLPTPLTRFGLIRGAVNDSNSIDHWIDQARTNGWYPTSLSIYGTSSDPWYAIIMEDNPDGICWAMDGLLDTAADHQARFDALVPAHARLVHVAVSPDGSRYASIFRDDQIPNWSAIHNLDSAGYQQAFDALVPQGVIPVMVQAGGVGAGARFAANFAQDDTREPLAWGPPTGPVTVSTIDNAMHDAMQRHRIRGAALALVRDGRLVYARGYTYAEPGYPTVEPTTFFRQASASKTIVALAVHRLIQDGRLTLSTTVQSKLALTGPDGSSPPASFSQVTVQHLLEHTSGLAIDPKAPPPRYPASPYGVEPAVVDAFNAPLPQPAFSLPVDGTMTDRHMLTLPTSAPPDPRNYNNWGYFLLGHVVKAVTGQTSLVQALDTLLFQPLGITRIRQARTRLEDQPSDEARYHPTSFATGGSVMESDRRLRASAFGGGWNLERDDGAGGLTGAATDIARLLAMLDVRTNNPVLGAPAIANLFSLAAVGPGHGFDTARVINPSAGAYYGMKGGDIPESNQNCVRYQTDDLSMVMCWNRSNLGEGTPLSDAWWYPEFPALLGAARANAWGTSDLFPVFGMPSFGLVPTMQLAGITSDGSIWHTIRGLDGSWMAFGDVKGQAGNVGTFAQLAIAAVVGEMQLAGVTTDGNIWHTIRRADGSWLTFGDIKSQAGDPGAFRVVSMAEGADLQLAGVTTDGNIWHTIRHANGSWEAFGNIKGPAGDVGSFTAVATADLAGELQLVGVTADGNIWHTIRHTNGSWEPFGNIKGQAGNVGSFTVAATADLVEELQLVGVTADGNMWHTIRHANGSWDAFGNVKGPAGDVGILTAVSVADVADELQLSCAAQDGNLWHTIRHADGTWQPFGNVKGVAGDPGAFTAVAIAATVSS